MAVFAYQGTGERGERRSGEVEASTRAEALRRLTKDRIQPLTLVAKADQVLTARKSVPNQTADAFKPRRNPGASGRSIRLSHANLILFTDELSDFLHSGLQLEPALHLMENREEKSPVKDVAVLLREKLRDGVSFSDALKMASPSFGELYCNLVAAGEVSGALAPLLRRQSQYLVALQELRSRVTMALIYPAFLVGAGILAMVVFMTVLVPQMTSLFAQTGGSMPLPTLLLVKAGKFSHQYGLLVIILALIFLACFIFYIRQPAGRQWWDGAKLKLPLAGSLLKASFYAQFCQTLANLLQNGLPLLTALKLMSRVTGNLFYRASVLRITDLVGEGASLTRAMKTAGNFPADLRDLVKVGEQTGDLGATLEKVGQRYEKVIQQRIDRVMSIIPPVIIAVLGIMVLLLAWSMLSGIFRAIDALHNQAHT
ncbi:MAG TPA: type II secretion system F family protein [Candidatus Methylacidiphilales bacterium]|nr:type II secretion system F family protein [Candidatus Methylacidiphilales bacterium]